MTHKIDRLTESIFEIRFSGDLDEKTTHAFLADIDLLLNDYSADLPVNFLVDNKDEGRMSYHARKRIAEFTNDKRIHRFALINSKRANRVIAQFAMKITGRQNIRFFDSKETALEWLKQTN